MTQNTEIGLLLFSKIDERILTFIILLFLPESVNTDSTANGANVLSHTCKDVPIRKTQMECAWHAGTCATFCPNHPRLSSCHTKVDEISGWEGQVRFFCGHCARLAILHSHRCFFCFVFLRRHSCMSASSVTAQQLMDCTYSPLMSHFGQHAAEGELKSLSCSVECGLFLPLPHRHVEIYFLHAANRESQLVFKLTRGMHALSASCEWPKIITANFIGLCTL